MEDTRATFQPDEWAVLRHSSGGRLFQVGRVEETRQAGRAYRVWENWTGRPGEGSFNTSSVWLVRVKDREAAVALVAVLGYAHDQYRRDASELERRRDRAFDSIVADMEVYEEASDV